MDLSTDIWGHCLQHAALSDVGLRRAKNEDAYIVVLAGDQADFDRRGHLFMVADGMGGHAAGELASKMATNTVALAYRKLPDPSPADAIRAAVLEANRAIHARGQASPEFEQMGTTATVLVLAPAGVIAAHVGDSRAYRLRGSRIEQLTFDHTRVWEIRAAGQTIDPAMAAYFPKNIITHSLGPKPTEQVDLEGPFPVQAGDTFLLCSDGLSNQVSDDEIGLILSCLPPAAAVQALVDLACLRGGPDNITAVVVRVLGPQVAAPSGAEPPPAAPAAPFTTRPVHPLLWTGLGVALLAAVGLLLTELPWLALACFLAALATLVAALVQRYGGRPPSSDSRHFGRGPYTATDCAPTPELLRRLAGIIQQIRSAAQSEHWTVDWTDFNRLVDRASAAAEGGHLLDAARDQLHAIVSIMAQLRRQQPASSDSGVISL